MKIRNFLTCLLSLAFAFSLTACKGGDDDSSSSSVNSISSESESDSKDLEGSCTFTVVTDKGIKVANASFTLTSESNTYTLTTNENGVASADIPAGTYGLDFDFETLPENHMQDVWTVEIGETANISLLLIDNTPDGSLEKPFWLNGDVTAINLSAGEEIYYQCRNNFVTFEIANENVSVTYNGTTYTAESGVVSFTISHDIGAASLFSVKNNGDTAVETQLKTVYKEGTLMNPILLTGDSGEDYAELVEGEIRYYKWIATKDGTFTITSPTPNNNISLQNDMIVSDSTLGESSTSITCATGDVIIITISTLDGEADIIDFMYAI